MIGLSRLLSGAEAPIARLKDGGDAGGEGVYPHPNQIIGRTLRSLAFTQFHTLNCAKYPAGRDGEKWKGAGDRSTSPISPICVIW
jgi:hypothetical protein